MNCSIKIQHFFSNNRFFELKIGEWWGKFVDPKFCAGEICKVLAQLLMEQIPDYYLFGKNQWIQDILIITKSYNSILRVNVKFEADLITYRRSSFLDF